MSILGIYTHCYLIAEKYYWYIPKIRVVVLRGNCSTKKACCPIGALDGGPHCRMSILRDGNVACPCRLFSLMSHVESKK